MTPSTSDLKQARLLLVLALVSFAVMSPVLFNGLPSGYDLPHHYQCATTFVESIRSGDLYPSWSLNRNLGYGGMESRLYPPVSHYTLALFYLGTNSWHIASFLTLYLFTLLGSLGIYLWAKEYVRPAHAAFAGCVFVLLPYHLNQIYNTFLFAEYAGTSLLPFVFLYVTRVCKRGKSADVIGLGISYAALLLTHLPLTVIGSVSVGVFAVFSLRRDAFLLTSLKVAAGVLIGFCCSAFFIVKVIQERTLLAKTSVYGEDWIDYRFHFVLSGVYSLDEGTATTVYTNALFFYDLIFVALLAAALAFSLPFLRRATRDFKLVRGAIAIFLLTVFLATPLSRPLWDRIALIQEIQFPWRWLAITSLVVPIIMSAGLKPLQRWFTSNRRPFALIIIGVFLAVLTFSISQVIRPAPVIPISDIDATVEKASLGEGFTFWWPVWARKEAMETKQAVVPAGREVRSNSRTSVEETFSISSGAAGDLHIPVFYHPNWYATVDNLPVETRPDLNGAISVPIPERATSVVLFFKETTAVTLAQVLSFLVWVLCGAFVAIRAADRRRSRTGEALLPAFAGS